MGTTIYSKEIESFVLCLLFRLKMKILEVHEKITIDKYNKQNGNFPGRAFGKNNEIRIKTIVEKVKKIYDFEKRVIQKSFMYS